MPRRPRQPKKTGRKQKRSYVQKNPKNVRFVDRQIVPYKSAKGYVAPYAYNVEMLSIVLPNQLTNMAANSATTAIPKNTTLFMPAMFNSATETPTVNQPNGQWLTPKYLTSKFRISFDKIVADHADSRKGFNIWLYHGVIKNTGSKNGARVDSQANWTTDIETLVGQELVNSDFSSDYLDFTQKNRNVQIIKKQMLKPSRDNTIRKAIIAGTSEEVYTAPSPICMTIKHQVPNFKQRYARPNIGTSALIDPLLNNMYIPFVAVCCDELTRNTGTITVEQSSKFYFTDM